MASMADRSLGRGRDSVTVVALGTWQRREAAASRQHRELTEATIAADIRLIDTSPMCDDAERVTLEEIMLPGCRNGRSRSETRKVRIGHNGL
jgi:aryl-alcohol dehydrogenase-like predicted oxidoreductase